MIHVLVHVHVHRLMYNNYDYYVDQNYFFNVDLIVTNWYPNIKLKCNSIIGCTHEKGTCTCTWKKIHVTMSMEEDPCDHVLSIERIC